MTLIVGIKCSNGIVVGADGAATLGNTVGLRTVIQPVAKLTIVRGAIVAVSGPVGIGQLFTDRVDTTYNSLRDLSAEEAARTLREAFLKDAEVALRACECIGVLLLEVLWAIGETPSMFLEGAEPQSNAGGDGVARPAFGSIAAPQTGFGGSPTP